jgi:hypothetical protein
LSAPYGVGRAFSARDRCGGQRALERSCAVPPNGRPSKTDATTGRFDVCQYSRSNACRFPRGLLLAAVGIYSLRKPGMAALSCLIPASVVVKETYGSSLITIEHANMLLQSLTSRQASQGLRPMRDDHQAAWLYPMLALLVAFPLTAQVPGGRYRVPSREVMVDSVTVVPPADTFVHDHVTHSETTPSTICTTTRCPGYSSRIWNFRAAFRRLGKPPAPVPTLPRAPTPPADGDLTARWPPVRGRLRGWAPGWPVDRRYREGRLKQRVRER